MTSRRLFILKIYNLSNCDTSFKATICVFVTLPVRRVSPSLDCHLVLSRLKTTQHGWASAGQRYAISSQNSLWNLL